MKQLGYANGWSKTPEKIKQCRELGHVVKSRALFGRCHTEYYCEICNYSYKVDSSD